VVLDGQDHGAVFSGQIQGMMEQIAGSFEESMLIDRITMA
jgi:hypothetical protein